MAKVWSDFYDWVLPQVPGCSTTVADKAIREATIDFYDRTGLLVYQPADVTIAPGTATYTLVPPASYDVQRIDEAFVGSLRLIPVSNTQLAQMYIDWLTMTGTPQYYLRESTDILRLVPKPDPAMTFPDPLTLRLVIIPTRASTGIAEDWVFESWADDIAAGALARLMRMPAVPWMNLERAFSLEEEFRRAWARARAEADRGKSGAVLQIRLKRFF